MNGSGRQAPDVVVVGAGVMGAWTALHARRQGWAVTLLDAFGAGHSRATSGDETRIIRCSHGPDPFYGRWSREARLAWIELGAAAGEQLFIESGALWFARDPDGFEAASQATLQDLGIPVERLDRAEVAARWPQLAVDDIEFAVFEPEAGLLKARRGVMAAVAQLEREGGGYRLGAAVPGRRDGRRLIDVRIDGGNVVGDVFIFAAGPWLPRLFPEVLGDVIRVTKQDVMFIGPPEGDPSYDSDHLPCWVDYGASFYGIPAVEGRGMKLAPDRYGPVFDPTHGERIVDPESVRLARRYLGRRFPGLTHAPVVETRVCQYETTPDTQYVIDRHPDFDNVWLVGGGSGHAFKQGPMIGRYVTERLAGATTGVEARFGLSHVRTPKPNLRTGADGIVTGFSDW